MQELLTTPTLLASVVSIIFGGLAGAIVSSKHSSNLSKRQLTVTIIKDYIEKYHDLHAECVWLIQQPHSSEASAVSNINNIIKMGNWAESVAVLCSRGLVDKVLLEEYGLLHQLRRLYKDVCSSPLNTHAKFENMVSLKKL